MVNSETPSYHSRRRLLLITVGLLITSSLVSFSHAVSSSCHHRPSSTSFQGKSFVSFKPEKPLFSFGYNYTNLIKKWLLIKI